jgi:thiamine-monophosphate kinase
MPVSVPISKMRIGEDELIDRIRRRIPSSPVGAVRLGIGDDAAVIRPRPGTEWVCTCDQFLENVHFLATAFPPEAVGYKALARATSDVGAMGAKPRFFLLSLALPAKRTGIWLDKMTRGMSRAARQFGLTLAGGDTARSPASNPAVALNLTVVGEIAAGHAVSRSGARPGDAIFVSGRLGGSQLGLELILRGMARERRWLSLIAPHFYPKPPIELGCWLAARRFASAMMDISDGLSSDLYRLCQASHAGARIYQEKLPGIAVPAGLRSRGFDALALALHGGEDYGLLFTVGKRHVASIPRVFRGQRVTRIGEIVVGSGVTLLANGTASVLGPQGWDHFRKTR